MMPFIKFKEKSILIGVKSSGSGDRIWQVVIMQFCRFMLVIQNLLNKVAANLFGSNIFFVIPLGPAIGRNCHIKLKWQMQFHYDDSMKFYWCFLLSLSMLRRWKVKKRNVCHFNLSHLVSYRRAAWQKK